MELSKNLNRSLTESEQQVISVKYKSVSFGKMPPEEILYKSKLLLLKIYVITGWQIPESELKTILVEQLCRKMIESYPNVNQDEVEYAFRNRDVEVKDWGKNFSITLLDEVMQPYLRKRFELSKIEESIKSKPLHLEENKEISDEEMKEWINEWKVKVKSIKNPVLIPTSFYDWLDKKEIIKLTKEQKHDYMGSQAVSVRQFNLAEQSKLEGIHGESTKYLVQFNNMRNEGVFVGDEVKRLTELAKKIAVFDYLKSCADESRV